MILIRAAMKQGATLVKFHEKMGETFVQYVIISIKSDLEDTIRKIRGKLNYEKILKYEYIIDALNKFKKIKIDDYVLFNNS